jgi:hypothetical protein
LHILEKQSNHCSLPDDNSSPDKWLSNLENIRTLLKLDHKYEISEDKLITQRFYNAPSRNYATVLTILKMKLLIDGNLELMEIKMAFIITWAGIKQMSPNTTQQSETDLNVKKNARPSTFKKKFKGDCRTCGQKGHKSADLLGQ